MQIQLARKALCLAWLFCAFFFTIPLSGFTIEEPSKVYGRAEMALITDHSIPVHMRMDTGAQTSSLSAAHIEVFKKKGKEWVRFIVEPERTDKLYQLELPLTRHIKIRKRHGESTHPTDLVEHRVSVTIPVCLGAQRKMIEVSLTDRSRFEYPMLLGRSGMEAFGILIDPSKIDTIQPHCSTSEKINAEGK